MAAYWPTATGPLAQWMNDTPKVVLSNTAPDTSIWQNSTVATGDGTAEVERRPDRAQPGRGQTRRRVLAQGQSRRGRTRRPIFADLQRSPAGNRHQPGRLAQLPRPRSGRILVILRRHPAVESDRSAGSAGRGEMTQACRQVPPLDRPVAQPRVRRVHEVGVGALPVSPPVSLP
jgi:hypothetical protein